MRSRLAIFAAFVALAGCEPASEAPRVQLPVVVDSSGLGPVGTDLGYDVQLHEARLVVRDFTFQTAGELHTGIRLRFVSTAKAHPGHHTGGTVAGELRGRFLVDLLDDGGELGLADLLAGDYESASFVFDRASGDDALDGADPLVDHTAVFRGSASREGETREFLARVAAPPGRELVGAPFEATLAEDEAGAIGFRALLHDPRGGRTLFDGVDFFAIESVEGLVRIEPEAASEEALDAYDTLRRTFSTHDHYDALHIQDGP